MTDETDAARAIANWRAQEAARQKLAEQIRPANKAVLFDALARAGIARVVVRFDGYGDSGQIEEIAAKANSCAVELPALEIEIASPRSDGSGVDRSRLSPRETIETMAYDFLEETHRGWENDEGAFGDFCFDVAERTIRLEYNERMTNTEYYEHEF